MLEGTCFSATRVTVVEAGTTASYFAVVVARLGECPNYERDLFSVSFYGLDGFRGWDSRRRYDRHSSLHVETRSIQGFFASLG